MHAVLAALLLSGIAVLAPLPQFSTDRPVYERMADEWIIPNCGDWHCFRISVPWTLGRLPGDGYVKWRAYAVMCQALAGLAMAHWALRLGLPARSAAPVVWLTALGSGAQYTVFDPFTSDPLMHMLAPMLLTLLWDGWIVRATLLSMFGIFAKEFALVPLAVMAVVRTFRREWGKAHDTALGAATVLAVWVCWSVVARAAFGYSTGPTPSAGLLSGSFLFYWLARLTPSLIVVTVVAVFAGVWILWPYGLKLGSRSLRAVTGASVVPLAFFNYVQQPDRALWNFTYLAIPAAAFALDRVPPAWLRVFVVLHVLVALRVGAQLPYVPPARVSLVLAIGMALAVVWRLKNSVATA